jgi:hypothetical protein
MALRSLFAVAVAAAVFAAGPALACRTEQQMYGVVFDEPPVGVTAGDLVLEVRFETGAETPNPSVLVLRTVRGAAPALRLPVQLRMVSSCLVLPQRGDEGFVVGRMENGRLRLRRTLTVGQQLQNGGSRVSTLFGDGP